MGEPGRTAPSGLVTFLFTDIEGSTKLFHAKGESYVELLAQHHRIVRSALARHGGYEVKTDGDAFFIAFDDATEAVLACAEAQVAIESHPWPEGGRIRVRMGLHTAQATAVDGDYVSIAVHQTARISSAPNGGQIVMSEDTANLVRGSIGDLQLLDLGRYKLKDFEEPQALYELRGPRLPTGFPALRVPPASLHNLPRQQTSFIGRSQEVATLTELLSSSPLVTLLAMGGAGKTRLAVEVASRLVPHFDQGVWFVDLAAITEPGLVPAAFANALGVAEVQGASITDTLLLHLSTQSTLLVVDNCEQVVDPVGDLVDAILAAAPGVRVLATSREVLRVRGEQLWPIKPLSTPSGEDAHAVLESESGQLFVERARLVSPGWQLDESLASELASVCRSLDGMPLALELAAARMGTMTLPELVTGLDNRLDILVGGARGDAPRQRTLRALIAWSYELLPQVEQIVFSRLSVFRGGFGEDAAIAVTAFDGISADQVAACLTSLIQKSLLEVDDDGDGNPRYRLLVSIRAYGDEVLEASGAALAVKQRHLDWVLGMLTDAAEASGTPDHGAALDRLEREHDNIRGAQDFGFATDATTALRVAYGAAAFRFIRGHVEEGRSALRSAIAQSPGGTLASLAHAQSALGKNLSENDVVGGEGRELLERALAAFRDLEDKAGSLAALLPLAEDLRCDARFDEARAALNEARRVAAEVGDLGAEALTVIKLSFLASDVGEKDEARSLAQEAVVLATRAGDRRSVGIALHALAVSQWHVGEHRASLDAATEALTIFRSLGDRRSQGLANLVMGATAGALGDRLSARSHLAECLRHCIAAQGLSWFPEILLQIARLEAESAPDTAAVLLGSTRAQCEIQNAPLDPELGAQFAACLASVESALGAGAQELFATGVAMPYQSAMDYALQVAEGSAVTK